MEFNRKISIFCGPLEKELRKILVKCFVWSVALYEAGTWTLRRSKEKRTEPFEIYVLFIFLEETVLSSARNKQRHHWFSVIVSCASYIRNKLTINNGRYYLWALVAPEDMTPLRNEFRRIYKTITLPVVLYGCETWTLTLREEQRLRVFENKVLREIFGAKRDEVTGEWRKLHNAELHALYSSPDIIRNIKSRRSRWAGYVARMGEFRNAFRMIVGRAEGKIRFGRPRRRWEDNIKMDLREVGYDGRDWINLAQDRDRWRAYVRAVMNLRVP
ncbi:hypothetical protein ANN_25068 [Periplaneta americana]|uniref:Uncharacterized protein n=1 Tax=Periplaneta americana TaxID=6978 RepID=A0ABQ8S0P3_PERAM|nr:hypothetical protein ANN_25068 [Periplaneta americana]